MTATNRATGFSRIRGAEIPVPEVPMPAVGNMGHDLARLVALAAGLAGEVTSDVEGPHADVAGGRLGRMQMRATDRSTGEPTPAQGGATADSVRTPPGSNRVAGFGAVLASARAGGGHAAADVERVAELVRANIGTRSSSITIRLDPPELGRIELEARLQDDVLSVRVTAETEAARELLHGRLSELRRALDRHGITLDRVDVEPPRPSAGGGPSNGRESSDSRSGGNSLLGDGGAASGHHGGLADGTSRPWAAASPDAPAESEYGRDAAGTEGIGVGDRMARVDDGAGFAGVNVLA